MKTRRLEKKFLRSRASKIILGILSVFLVVILGAFWALSQPKSVICWEKASGVAPAGVLKAAVQQNYLPLKMQKPLDENQIKALKVPEQGAGNLYIIDFNSSQVCGSGGCLYVAYTQQEKPVLRVLLNPQLPKETPLFSVGEQVRNGFSCLELAQSTGKENSIYRRRYCYEGTGFTLVNSSITKGGA